MRISQKFGVIVGLSAVLALIGTKVFTAGGGSSPVGSSEESFRLVHQISSVQAKGEPYGLKTNFGTLSQVLELIPSIDATFVNAQEASYKEYTIRMTLSADRKHFELSVMPSAGRCGTSWFTNEHWTLYSGQPTGCK